MTIIAIVGSRTYQPLGDVTHYVACLPKATTLICPGSSPLVLLAAEIAKARGLTVEAIPLDPRRPFLDRIDQLVVFAATDPATKRITSGTAGMIVQAEQMHVPFDIHRAPLSGRLCTQLTAFQAQRARVAAIPASQDRRRLGQTQRLLQIGAVLSDERDRLAAKLDAGYEALQENDNEVDFARWTRWRIAYETLCNALQDGLETAA